MNTSKVKCLFVLLVIASARCHEESTRQEVSLYMRQSWVKMCAPYSNFCICESGVNPAVAYKSLMLTEVPSDPCLKCYYHCLLVKLNLIEATTGLLVEEEFLRQMEGVTPEIFKKCEKLTRYEVDLCKKSFDTYLCVVHATQKPTTPVLEKEY
ncbi:hypothetical protein FQA39_LY06321 [Lamprigera yunnana]|nr:hypothetical protein FQA39_LY06321 [Lamprigera yunnana]